MTTKYDLTDRVAIITGAASGIGKATAQNLHRNGAKVVIADIQIEPGRQAAEALGDKAFFHPCDVTDSAQVNALTEAAVERFGSLDIMVNNAGINAVAAEDRVTVDEYSEETWRKIIDVDLNGTFYCSKAAAKIMKKQQSGVIINIASIAGVVALRLQLGFVAAKAAIIKITEAMACELAPSGIRVNVVSPGSTLTEVTRQLFYSDEGSFSEMADKVVSFIPQRRPGEAEEMADAVAFLASDSASYINGHNLIVDGGWTCGFNRDF